MRNRIALLLIAIVLVLSSCCTERVVVRYQPGPAPYCYYVPVPPRPLPHRVAPYHLHRQHAPRHQHHHQPAIPPKPQKAPSATVRPRQPISGGSMSGRRRR